MAGTYTEPALFLRRTLKSLFPLFQWWHQHNRGVALLPPLKFEGDGATVDFPLPEGQAPYAVFIDGDVLIGGTSADDYTVEDNGFNKYVQFQVPPSGASVVVIFPAGI